MGGRNRGVSSSFRHLCAAILPRTSLAYLRVYGWRKETWNLLFVAGMVAGGILLGFGTRWAAGCTSGHSIMGLSNLQKSSLVATLAFFAGGLSAALVHRLFGLGD